MRNRSDRSDRKEIVHPFVRGLGQNLQACQVDQREFLYTVSLFGYSCDQLADIEYPKPTAVDTGVYQS